MKKLVKLENAIQKITGNKNHIVDIGIREMIRADDIRIDTGRCFPRGTLIRVIHFPTGIMREKGPIGNVEPKELVSCFLKEIEQELIEKNLTEYLIED